MARAVMEHRYPGTTVMPASGTSTTTETEAEAEESTAEQEQDLASVNLGRE